jgi:hypothetical protein
MLLVYHVSTVFSDNGIPGSMTPLLTAASGRGIIGAFLCAGKKNRKHA